MQLLNYWTALLILQVLLMSSNLGKLRQLTEDLERLESLCYDFFSFCNALICIADGLTNKFLIVSDEWCRILGYSKSELVGQDFIQFIHPDDREKTLTEAYKLNLGHITVDFINRYQCKNGTYIALKWRARQVRNKFYASAVIIE